MSDIALRITNISKCYRIGARQPYYRFSELLSGIPRAVLGSVKNLAGLGPKKSNAGAAPDEQFWALRDVSFDVKRGEVLGIVGRNGAGKSTLLKILSRVTEPTSGNAQIHGRLGALLEVGSGFHPELSGRDNIYLNGAILSMSRAEVSKKFDEIVAFSEVERFLDTPVKHYSSGMYMRLAFAVAAHLETETLILDEILAVGDVQFQRKCLGKMGEVANSGRTVLFVSHNLAAVRSLCSKVVVLDRGRVAMHGDTAPVLAEYSTAGNQEDEMQTADLEEIKVIEFRVGQHGRSMVEVDGSLPIEVMVDYVVKKPMVGFRTGFFLINPTIGTLTRCLTPDWDPVHETPTPGRYTAKFEIPARFLKGGNYTILLHASCYGIKDYLARLPIQRTILVHQAAEFNPLHPTETFDGMFIFGDRWTVEKTGPA